MKLRSKIPSACEKAILKLALGGGSVIDWPAGRFDSRTDVMHFLKINEFDLSRQRDLDRLMGIHNEAVGYLQRELRFELSPELTRADRIVECFLAASDRKRSKIQKQACSLLKTMNIINHIDGRELLTNCPISLRDLFSLVEDKVERTLSNLSLKETFLLKYEGGRKQKESLVTKLLCKRETIAAQIYDRVRYRIVTRTREDIVRVMTHLFDTILPFNYIIPEVSVNQMIPLDARDAVRSVLKTLSPLPRPIGEYSGHHYKVLKFVVDIPVRMDNFLSKAAGPAYRESLGSIAYVLVEFQIVDEETERRNNSGNCRHDKYKERQKRGVIKRLTKG